MLNYKKGIPIFIISILVFDKLLLPYEFSFTHTLSSKKILPTIKLIENLHIFKSLTVGHVFLYIWLFIAVLFLMCVTFRHWKLIQILSIIPGSTNKEINQLISELCNDKQIRNKPKVVQLNYDSSPFIVGVRNPIIVIPNFQLSNNENRFILSHELEHLKHYHIIIKTCLEIVAAIYWWNPIVWLLRREVICAMELQADTKVMQELSNKSSLSYLETLLHLSKKEQQPALALSFALKNSMTEYRIRTAIKYSYYHKKIKTTILDLLPLVLSIVILLFSFGYTFESYNVNPTDVGGTFIINPKTDYFVLREDNSYDLYINKKYVMTTTNIPNELSYLSIH
jgi:beta-lactamase regulating signal transducer with metallopeptidase domain